MPGPEGTNRYLVASELHLGIEGELSRRGAYLRSRADALAEALLADAKAAAAKRLLLLGDVKHHYMHASRQEHRDVPRFFQTVSASMEEIRITIGNHDTGLSRLLPRAQFPRVRLSTSAGLVLGQGDARVAAFHGHARPLKAAFRAPLWLVGHTHAAARLVDENGQVATEWAWLRGRLLSDAAPRGIEYVVFPPYNPLCGGTPVNRDGILGPLGAWADPETSGLWLLDGRHAMSLAGAPLRARRGAGRDT